MEPDTAATNMVAHTMSTFKRPISADILKPIPTIGVPKNSATIAPISARVELIFRELKTNGKETGILRRIRFCQ